MTVSVRMQVDVWIPTDLTQLVDRTLFCSPSKLRVVAYIKLSYRMGDLLESLSSLS